jgi:threonyl-tRNA synthetase
MEKIGIESLRIEIDENTETVGYKIRHAAEQKIPYTLVIGEKELPQNGKWTLDTTLVIRKFGKKDTIQMKISAFIETIQQEIIHKS